MALFYPHSIDFPVPKIGMSQENFPLRPVVGSLQPEFSPSCEVCRNSSLWELSFSRDPIEIRWPLSCRWGWWNQWFFVILGLKNPLGSLGTLCRSRREMTSLNWDTLTPNVRFHVRSGVVKVTWWFAFSQFVRIPFWNCIFKAFVYIA